ncbi:MAG: hypothetical protein KBT36_07070 [Kurthia sp.]|nr:hypothetical protein [Candidatus Kurthia equi]
MPEKTIQIVSKYVSQLMTTGVISLVLTVLNYTGDGFPLFKWVRGWLVAFVLLVVLAQFLPQTISKGMAKLFKKNKNPHD